MANNVNNPINHKEYKKEYKKFYNNLDLNPKKGEQIYLWMGLLHIEKLENNIFIKEKDC